MAADYTLTLNVQPTPDPSIRMSSPVAVPYTTLEVFYVVPYYEFNLTPISQVPSLLGGGGSGGGSTRPTTGMLYPRRQC